MKMRGLGRLPLLDVPGKSLVYLLFLGFEEFYEEFFYTMGAASRTSGSFCYQGDDQQPITLTSGGF
jgi:hypothetical protein